MFYLDEEELQCFEEEETPEEAKVRIKKEKFNKKMEKKIELLKSFLNEKYNGDKTGLDKAVAFGGRHSGKEITIPFHQMATFLVIDNSCCSLLEMIQKDAESFLKEKVRVIEI